jgi:hypothetical protein
MSLVFEDFVLKETQLPGPICLAKRRVYGGYSDNIYVSVLYMKLLRQSELIPMKMAN